MPRSLFLINLNSGAVHMSYGGELARLGGLACQGEMIFIPRSYGIFYLSLIKKFVMSLEKDCLIK